MWFFELSEALAIKEVPLQAPNHDHGSFPQPTTLTLSQTEEKQLEGFYLKKKTVAF